MRAVHFVGARSLHPAALARAMVDGDPGSLTVDLSKVNFVEPSGLVVVAVLLDHAAALGWPTTFIPPKNPDPAKYLSRMGLGASLTAAGVQDCLPSVRRWPAGDRFVELQRLDVEHPGDDVGDLLYSRLAAWDDGYLQTTIFDAMFELAINVEEHARTPGFVAAQCYRSGKVKVAVGDLGVGIQGSLEAAGYEFGTASQAITEAVTTRLSSKSANGGAGLGSVIDIFSMHSGWVVVVSGGESVVFQGGAEPRIGSVGYPTPGTFLFGELRWK